MAQKRFAILTCMDSRLDPVSNYGLEEGDYYIIRNAGGRATEDAIRSMIISHKFLGTSEWWIVHHTDCKMGLITDELIGELLEEDLETAVLDRRIWSNQKKENTKNTKPGSSLARQMKWHTFTDLEQSVVDDVKTIKHHELVPNDIKVKGFIFNLEDHELRPVVT